jgi:tRNA(Ile)-lysidine synthase
MNRTLAKVIRYTIRHELMSGARGVVVAVSGGPDSVVLLDLLVRLRDGPAELPGSGLHLHVAHLDHCLRGAESEKDAEFVRCLSERYGLPVTIGTSDVRAASRISRRGIEAAAREARYTFLLEVALSAGFEHVATGHTMNDQAETLVMRLLRGTGPRGLGAMRPAAPVPTVNSNDGPVRLIRPLLCLTRAEIESYCAEHGLEHRVDSSNFHPDYTRNRIRQSVIPLLEELNPRVIRALARTASNVAIEQDALQNLAVQLLSSSMQSDPQNGVRGSAYSASVFCEQSVGLRRRMILEAIAQTSGQAGAGMKKRHIAAIDSLLTDGESGMRVHLPGRIEVWREFDLLVFRKCPPAKAAYCYELNEVQSNVEAEGIFLEVSRGLTRGELPRMIVEAEAYRRNTGKNWLFAALDDDCLPGALVVRPRLPGERAVVLRHRETIKLKKLMIDHKIPASRRAIWPVVTTPDGRYIWSPGMPPAVDFAARDETRAIAVVRAWGL